MSVLAACTPRAEVLQGDLDDAIFAADFGNLLAGTVPAVYREPATFFRNTHPAAQLKRIVSAVFERLADTKEPGATIRLSTGFGGGKTHALMALWHLAHNVGTKSLGTELLPAAGRPAAVTVVALDAGKAGVPNFSVHDGRVVRSLWGEIFWQLGGAKALSALGKADDTEASPGEAEIEAVLPKGPVLVLLDELVIYMARLSPTAQGNVLGFVNSLTSIASKRAQTALVISDPSNQQAFEGQAAALAAALQTAATRINDVLGRRASDFDPIGNEGARIITRRLFERIDAAEAERVSAVYFDLFQRVNASHHGTVPVAAASQEYARRIKDSYPFHPRLLDTAQDRLGAIQEFNRSRGTLRLFARVVRDLWDRKLAVELISAGDVDPQSPPIRADLLHRLHRVQFEAAVSADIGKHAAELDGGAAGGIHQRVATALLLESIPMQSNSGLDDAEATLAVLRPDDAGHEPAEALHRLAGACWHIYPLASGHGFQFKYEPNIIKQIDERMGQVPREDAVGRLRAEAQQYFAGPDFKLVAWPTAARMVPESADLQLTLCDTEAIAKLVTAQADDHDPSAPIPRRFVNAIVAVAPTPATLENAIDRARRMLAAETIERDVRHGDTNALARAQLHKLLPELRRQFTLQARRSFDRIVFASGKSYAIDESFQVPEDQILARPMGQAQVSRFLLEKHLVYADQDALDIGRLKRDILPGATPVPDQPGVVSAKAVHERFLAAPGLRLLPGKGVVVNTLIKGVEASELAVRAPDGTAYMGRGSTVGPTGGRRKTSNGIRSMALDDATWVTLAGSDAAVRWLSEDVPGAGDKPGAGEIPKPPPDAQAADAYDWDNALRHADDRPLIELTLTARFPAQAQTLLAAVQPLGAETLSLTVDVACTLRDGGQANFRMEGVKPTHPTRPLQIAQTIANAAADSSSYAAELTLAFGDGRRGSRPALEQTRAALPNEVEVRARYGARDEPA